MNFYIRKAVLSDAERCAAIHISSWEFAYSSFISADILEQRKNKRYFQWKKLLADSNDNHYVAVFEDKIIGIITLDTPRDEDLSAETYELTGLYFDPEYIGGGFGKLTMDWIIKYVSDKGYMQISLWVLSNNKRAKLFYEKAGFVPDGTSQNSGIDDKLSERYIYKIN